MTNRAQRVGLTAIWLAAFAIAAGAQLNPTVTVLSSPVAAVPSDCDQSVAPQPMPRVQVAEIPEPPKRNTSAAPPTASVRAQLKDVQNAADRSAFRDALARVKATVAVYPAGGEKAAAGDVIRVYDDLDRVWTWQMDSPTGAFFEAGSVPAQIMRGYPGFDRAIADQIFVNTNGTRFYPTVETRDFLVREAAQRLKKLGVTVATRAPRPARVLPRFATAPARAQAVEAKPAERQEPKARAATADRRPVKHRTTPRKHRAEAKIAETREKPSAKATTEPGETAESMSKPPQPKVAREKAPRPAAKAATTQKAAEKPKPAAERPSVPAPTTTASAPKPVPATASSPPPAATESETTSASSSAMLPATATTATTATTASTATETAASRPTTETSASAETTDTTGTAGKTQPQSKGVILPIILIVIGIGVLIVLFRASS
jgi:hypothetical protein